MKKAYEPPKIEVIRFEAEDIMTASGGSPGMNDGGNFDGSGEGFVVF